MDDKNFDKESALDWIHMIESEKAAGRQRDLYLSVDRWLNQDEEPQNILEIGCGQGDCLKYIDVDGHEYTGIDPSTFLLNRAKALKPAFKNKFVSGDVYKLPFEKGAFDTVFSIAVWHLLSDAHKAGAEISRVLRSAGRFLIMTAHPKIYPDISNNYDSSELIGNKFIGKSKSSEGVELTDVLYLNSIDETKNSLTTNNLNVELVEETRGWLVLKGVKL